MKFTSLLIHDENKNVISSKGSIILASGNVQLKFNLIKDTTNMKHTEKHMTWTIEFFNEVHAPIV